jgi:hypothetical protein
MQTFAEIIALCCLSLTFNTKLDYTVLVRLSTSPEVPASIPGTGNPVCGFPLLLHTVDL